MHAEVHVALSSLHHMTDCYSELDTGRQGAAAAGGGGGEGGGEVWLWTQDQFENQLHWTISLHSLKLCVCEEMNVQNSVCVVNSFYFLNQ